MFVSMKDTFLLILTDPPGAGKTTVGLRIASRYPHASCIESDWFYATITKGFVPK
jgi:adenylate kinase family enzyme